MKILVFGASGQLGHCLRDEGKDTGYILEFVLRSTIDITDFPRTAQYIRKLKPDVIINAAAFTSVEDAEDFRETAESVNSQAVKNIADVCRQINALLVHISTNYVFDGFLSDPYTEMHQPNPQSVYGVSKFNGESAVQSSGCKYMILRTAWVFSEYGSNFVTTMLNLANAGQEINLVSDQWGSPTNGHDLAKAILISLPRLCRDESSRGIYHYSGKRRASWFEFGQELFSLARHFELPVAKRLNAVPFSEYPTRASRPINGVLDSEKFEVTFELTPEDFSAGLESTFRAISLGKLKLG